MKKIFSLFAAVLMAGSMYATIASYTFTVGNEFPDEENGTQVATVYNGYAFPFRSIRTETTASCTARVVTPATGVSMRKTTLSCPLFRRAAIIYTRPL